MLYFIDSLVWSTVANEAHYVEFMVTVCILYSYPQQKVSVIGFQNNTENVEM